MLQNMSVGLTPPTPPHRNPYVCRHSKSQPPNRKENCFWPQIQVRRYSNAFSTPFSSAIPKGGRGLGGGGLRHIKRHYACDMKRGSRKHKPFHTPYTFAFARTQRTLIGQTERSCRVLLFMRRAGWGAWGWGEEVGAAYMLPPSMRSLALLAHCSAPRAVVVFLLLGGWRPQPGGSPEWPAGPVHYLYYL